MQYSNGIESHGNDIKTQKIKFSISALFFEENNGEGIHFRVLILNAYFYLKCSESMCNYFPEIGLLLIGSVFIGFPQKPILKQELGCR